MHRERGKIDQSLLDSMNDEGKFASAEVCDCITFHCDCHRMRCLFTFTSVNRAGCMLFSRPIRDLHIFAINFRVATLFSSHPSAERQTKTQFITYENSEFISFILWTWAIRCIEYNYYYYLHKVDMFYLQSLSFECVCARFIILCYWLIESERKSNEKPIHKVYTVRKRYRIFDVLWQHQRRHQRRTNSVHTIVIIKIIYADSISGWSSTQPQQRPHPHRPHSRISWKLLLLLVIIQTNKWLMHYCQR